MSTVAERSWPAMSHWWIDAVGGFLVFTKSRVTFGQVGGGSLDVPILGDLSSFHAEIVRGKEGHVLVAHAETSVNGKAGGSFLLKDGDRIRLRNVEWAFHQPLAWSSTSRLELVSRHRLPIAMNAIVLLGETCILGRRGDAHVPTPWRESVYLHWNQGGYWIRTKGPVRIDGTEYPGWGPLSPQSQVEGSWGSFHWEPAPASG